MPNVPTKEQVGARIAQLVRDFAAGNQSQFARLCGIEAPNVSRYAAGLHVPGGDHLARMALACGVSVDWILCMPGAVNDTKPPAPDGKIEIPNAAVALVDFESVRREVAGSPLGDRSITYMTIDEHRQLVDDATFRSILQQLDDASKRSSSRSRRRRPPSA